jgi:uncharacterized protein DUF6152
MESRQAMRLAFVILMSAAVPVFAHHSLEAAYNPHETVTLDGTVTKVDWSNPHVHFFIDVKNGNDVVNWQVELGSPGAQILRGWKIDTVRPGDRVIVSAYRARDGSNVGFAKNMTKGSR